MKKIISIFFLSGGLIAFCLFPKSAKVAGVRTAIKEDAIRGVILPHHNVAAPLIDKTLAKIQTSNNYRHIIIFGTNHFFPESPTLITADSSTNLNLDHDTINKFLKKFPKMLINNEMIKEEHSINILEPYLTQYFPQAKIIPFLVSPHFDPDEVNLMSNYLNYLVNDETLYIASVDFSHELKLNEGLKNNSEAIEVIRSFDYEKLWTYHNEHLDSPIAITFLLKNMQIRHTTGWETWENSHSALLTDSPDEKGTSYVIGVFR